MSLLVAVLAPQVIAWALIGILTVLVKCLLPVATRCGTRVSARREQRRRRRTPVYDTFGMLVPVAFARTQHRVTEVRRLLHEHGIRATVGVDNGRWVVLVFPEDAANARYDLNAAGV